MLAYKIPLKKTTYENLGTYVILLPGVEVERFESTNKSIPRIITKLCGGCTLGLEGYGNKHFLLPNHFLRILCYLSEMLSSCDQCSPFSKIKLYPCFDAYLRNHWIHCSLYNF